MKQFRPEILRFASMFILAAIAPLLGAEQAPRGESWRARAEQFVMVGGEVKIPNRVLFTNGMTALDTIRIAKGVTDKASKTRVEVRRREAKPVVLNRQEIERRKQEDFKLQPGDLVFVPRN